MGYGGWEPKLTTYIMVNRNHCVPTWKMPAVCSRHLPRLWWHGSKTNMEATDDAPLEYSSV